MCDFPFRRESGAENRIPGDFFAYFFGRAKKEMPRRHEAFGEAGARSMSGQKNKRPLATDIQLNLRLISIFSLSQAEAPRRRPATARCLLRPRWLRPIQYCTVICLHSGPPGTGPPLRGSADLGFKCPAAPAGPLRQKLIFNLTPARRELPQPTGIRRNPQTDRPQRHPERQPKNHGTPERDNRRAAFGNTTTKK